MSDEIIPYKIRDSATRESDLDTLLQTFLTRKLDVALTHDVAGVPKNRKPEAVNAYDVLTHGVRFMLANRYATLAPVQFALGSEQVAKFPLQKHSTTVLIAPLCFPHTPDEAPECAHLRLGMKGTIALAGGDENGVLWTVSYVPKQADIIARFSTHPSRFVDLNALASIDHYSRMVRSDLQIRYDAAREELFGIKVHPYTPTKRPPPQK